MKNRVIAFIERGNDGTYGVYIDLQDKTLNYGISGEGNTVEEAIKDFNTSYNEMKKFYSKKGIDFVEAEFVFKQDMASFLEYYNKIFTLAGLERLTGVNQAQLSHYLNGVKKPRRNTVEKIENKIHELGKELTTLEFT
ncbi:helix-turn-helix transcriptional regulator [Empedobacter brevis]|uniref:helix-turn-helix domain-containing protein n=1 Tax=Empedobacter brevis TaxID=247 RepID=UPI0028D54AD4|nr:helix-turn-helix transcriptional regulator [Empedobacter brevis]